MNASHDCRPLVAIVQCSARRLKNLIRNLMDFKLTRSILYMHWVKPHMCYSAIAIL